MSFLPYPAYKDSGTEWLGRVPDHWIKTSIKHVVAINMGQSPSSDDCNIDGVGVPFLQGNGEFGLKYPTPKQYCPVARKVADAGDLLFSVRAPVGALNEADQTYGIGRGLCAVKASMKISKQFLWHFLSSSQSFLDSISTGSTFEAVSAEQVENIAMALPREIGEQTQIARFLDHETARIDALIEEQQRLIELLKEKRQAVISHAVTKGLDPTVPMKDSGVEWLGEVPAHWAIKRLKQLVLDAAGIQMGPFGGMLVDLDDSDTGYKVYGQENTISGDFSSGNRWVPESRYFALSNYHLEVGDIVLTRKGSLGNCRRVSLLPQAGIIDSDTIRVRVQDQMMNPDYLELLLHEAGYISIQLSLVKRGAILSGLNSEIIANLVIVVPPPDGQEELLLEIKAASSKFDQGISDCEYAVGLLRERRSALISAAVTGKIDVRGWQPLARAKAPVLEAEAV